MRRLYRLTTGLLHAALYPYGRFRASQGKELWRGRMGLIPRVGPCDVWLHAASVGEVKVLGTLLDYLRRHSNHLTAHVTVMTRTGFATATSLVHNDVTVTYFPIDSPQAIRRTLASIQPQLLVIAETEIWPNLVSEAAAQNVAVVLVNGRMSSRAFRRYRLVSGTMRHCLSCYRRLFVRTAEDAQRIAAFRVPSDRIEIAGDMKFDAPLLPRSAGRIRQLRRQLGIDDGRFLIVAGSTRPGEEADLLRAYRNLTADHPDVHLLLAPRHVERAEEIRALIEQMNIPYSLYGEPRNSSEGAVILCDRMGLLQELYLAADLAFVGGTLVDVGGHNVLEPVWAGTPVVYGPHTDNVREAVAYIESHDFGRTVPSADELAEVVRAMRSGSLTFARKKETYDSDSATSRIGTYLLNCLSDA